MTEFPPDQWWVIARVEDVGRELTHQALLGQPVVLYRTLDGRPVALADRCAHRGFPLSKSTLIGDRIQCRYHGFAYDETGACVRVPAELTPPTRVCVRSFPLVERGPFVWLWPGDPAKANRDLVPDPDWVTDDSWAVQSGTLEVNGSWRHMHDNLLDLTHLSFLHNGVGGTQRYAEAAPDVTHESGRVQVMRRFVDDSPEAGLTLGITTPVQRESWSDWRSPALIIAQSKTTALDAAGEPTERATSVRFMHAITPISPTKFTYHWAVARDFMVDSDEVSQLTYEQSMTAFLEDADALQWIQEFDDRYPRPNPPEINVRTDQGGLRARRLIDQLLKP